MPKKDKKKKKKHSLFPAYCDKLLIITTFLLVIYSSIMIASAAMGEGAGDSSVITRSVTRQVVFFALGTFLMIFFTRHNFLKLLTIKAFDLGYWAILVLLLLTRLSGATYGAYGWIRIGGISIQPSEFSKVYIMMYGAKLLGNNDPENNKKNFLRLVVRAFIYFAIILAYQKDLGSAVVLAGITFVILLVPPYKELNKYHFRMLLMILGIIVAIVIIMLPGFNEYLSEHAGSSYKIGRFLAAYNPFAYQYSTGYHLIMGLVSFATGGWFGLGYGQSIHKYMNFPNPTTDFILPVIVEEMGIIGGLIPILVAYGILLYKLMRYSFKTPSTSSKMILSGSFAYLFIHFVLNVGGVSGLIPLTGVPLLLVSSGGSSLLATMMALGISESEIIVYRKQEALKNESNSGQI